MYSNRVCGLVFAIGLVSISSPVFGTGAGTMELRPVGVVGGNPPGTVISGNEITLTTTGVQVEFEIFVTWENILGTAQAKLDATTGYSSGAGTPLSAVGFPATPAHGAYITTQVCFFSGRDGCNAANGQPACTGAEGPCVSYGRFLFRDQSPAALTAVAFTGIDYEYVAVSQTGGATQGPGGINGTDINNYFGTLILEVPSGAAGTYTIPLKNDSLTTFLADENSLTLTLTLSPGVIAIACATNADCDDNDVCTDDVCNVSGQCENTPNYNTAQFCCNPTDGTLTPLDDGNACTAGQCNPDGSVTQNPRPVGTTCGNPASGECDLQDTCDGAGTCVNRVQPSGTACGSPSDTECDNPDTCDGTGVCRANPEPAGTACGDPTVADCNAADTCNGSGTCSANIQPAGTPCGDPSDTDCTNPDTCNASGVCQPNNAPVGLPCGNQIGNQCDNPDTCDASGLCQPNFRPAGTACGNPSDTECDNPDQCNGAGVCSPNNEPNGTVCTDDGNQCRDDVCQAGVCSHPFKPVGATCGDPSDTECDNPDSCDGAGTCLANREPAGAACGDPTSTDCNGADTCNGSGVCQSNIAPAGTMCGNPSDTDCDNPDTCNASGVCLPNFAPSGLPCGNQVGNQCDNPDTCNGSGTCNPNFVPAGTACGNPSNTDCDNPDSCSGMGVCSPNREPDGTLCPDDGNDCRDDVCMSGICTHPAKPVGAACGNPADTDCNDPDTCDGTGVCLVNILPSGTPCGDPTDDICTNPDTCNATGVCLANNAPNGTSCDVGQFCLTGATCLSGVCAGGDPRDCSDGLPCTDDSCDDVNDVCVNDLLPGNCLISGACYADGETNPFNDCEICDVLFSTTDWDFVAAGTLCDDGDPCTGTGQPGIGVDECDGSGLCIGTVDPSCNDDCINAVEVFDGSNIGNNENRGPDLVEASCQVDSNNDVWYFYTANCNGPVTVTTIGSQFLPDNDTVLSVYDDCPDNGGVEIACDDDSGPGLLSVATFTATAGNVYFIRVAGYQNDAGDLVLNINTLAGCVINDTCYLVGAVNPMNECEECNPLFSSTDWSPSAAGTPCGDPSDFECDAPDACDGTGICEANFKTDLTPCGDDGNDCTDDVCVSGACEHPFKLVGSPCGDPTVTECDAADTCDGAGFCESNFVPMGVSCGDPSTSDCDNADICDGSGACDPNFQPDGLGCTDDNNDCSDDVCSGGVCTHPPAPAGTACGDGSNTQCDKPDTCDGTGLCLANFEPSGTMCGDPTNTDCDDPDTCNGGGACVSNFVPVGTACGDPTDTDCDNPDTCDGGGACLSNFEITGFPCGDPSNTQCDQPDTCNGGGTCLSNFVVAGTACGDPSSSECDNPDTCDGGGACAVNHQPDGLGCSDDTNDCTFDECQSGICAHPPQQAGVPCGDPSATQCDDPDTCDGTGVCLTNFVSAGTSCGDPTNTDCDNPDSCDGTGSCASNLEPTGTACGDPSDTDCDNPDTCDGTGICLSNFEVPGLPCGDPSATQCDEPDTCDAAGACQSNFVAAGTPCGDPNDDQCDNPDTCTGAGLCGPNFEADGTFCNDNDVCTNNDQCQSGLCEGTPIPEAPLVEENGPRSVLATPQPPASIAPVALRVTSPDWPCLDKYVQADGTLAAAPLFQLPSAWGTISLVGVDMVPSTTYVIEAECGAFTSPAGMAQTCNWCDINCDGAVNGADILFQVNGFQGDFGLGVTFEAMDVHPCVPDEVINGLDILRCVLAFQFQQTYADTGCPVPCP